MIAAIGQIAPAMLTAVLLVIAAIEIAAPSPLLRRYDLCACIDRLDLCRVVDDLVTNFVHGRARRVDIAMRPEPDTRLVIEDVVLQPACRGSAPAGDEMLYPGPLEE